MKSYQYEEIVFFIDRPDCVYSVIYYAYKHRKDDDKKI